MDTENPVRIENAGSRCGREIIIVSTMTPFVIALLALVTSTFDAPGAVLSFPSMITDDGIILGIYLDASYRFVGSA